MTDDKVMLLHVLLMSTHTHTLTGEVPPSPTVEGLGSSAGETSNTLSLTYELQNSYLSHAPQLRLYMHLLHVLEVMYIFVHDGLANGYIIFSN